MDTFRRKAPLNDFQLERSPDGSSGGLEHSSILSSPLQNLKALFATDPERKKVALWPVLCMGIATGWSGHFFYWSNGLEAGFWLFLFSFLFVSSGLFALILCLAEVNSCLPFSGGSYGFSRITSTAFIAFVTGVCDRINLLAAFVQMLWTITILILRIFDLSIYYEILFWIVIGSLILIVYLNYLKTHLWKTYFPIIIWMLFTFYIIVMACLSFKADITAKNHLPTNYDNRTNPNTSKAVYSTFTDCIPLIFFFYHGIETIPFTANDIHEARKNLPKALISSFLFLFCSALILICLMSAVPPIYRQYSNHVSYAFSTELDESQVPTLFIFQPILHNVLNMPHYAIEILYFIPCFGSIIGFYYASIKILNAMTESHLYLIGVMRLFQRFEVKNLVCYVTIITGVIPMIILAFASYDLFNIAYTMSLYCFIISQICNLSSFITFRKKYMSLHREFVSPLGIPGAIYAIFVLLVMLIAILMRIQNRAVLLPLVGTLMIVFYSVYRRVQHHQIFSREEETILFLAHVMKANMARRHRYLSRPSIKTPTHDHSSMHSSASSRQQLRTTNHNRSSDSNDHSPKAERSFYSSYSSYQGSVNLAAVASEESTKEESVHVRAPPPSLKAISNDSQTSAQSYTRQSFLLNSSLVREVIPEEETSANYPLIDGEYRSRENSNFRAAAMLAVDTSPMKKKLIVSQDDDMESIAQSIEKLEEGEQIEENQMEGEFGSPDKLPSNSSLILSSNHSSQNPLSPRTSPHFLREEMFTKASTLMDEGEIFNTILDQSELLQSSKESNRDLLQVGGGTSSLLSKFLPSRSHSVDAESAPVSSANNTIRSRPSPSSALSSQQVSRKRNLLKASYLLLRTSFANSAKILPTASGTNGPSERYQSNVMKLGETDRLHNQSVTEMNDFDDIEEGPFLHQNSLESVGASKKQLPQMSQSHHNSSSNIPSSNHPSRAPSSSFGIPRFRGNGNGNGVINFSYIFDRIANSTSIDEFQPENGFSQQSVEGGTNNGMAENEYIKMISDKFAAKQVVLDNYLYHQRSHSKDSYAPSLAGSNDGTNASLGSASRQHSRHRQHHSQIVAPPNSVNSIEMRTPTTFPGIAANRKAIEEKFLTPEASHRTKEKKERNGPPTTIVSNHASPVVPTPSMSNFVSSIMKRTPSTEPEDTVRLHVTVKQSPPAASFYLIEEEKGDESEGSGLQKNFDLKKDEGKRDEKEDEREKDDSRNIFFEETLRQSHHDDYVYPITD